MPNIRSLLAATLLALLSNPAFADDIDCVSTFDDNAVASVPAMPRNGR